MKDKEFKFKPGFIGRVKLFWAILSMMRKSKKFYLISIDDFRDQQGMFQYHYGVIYKNLDINTWDEFLFNHFLTLKQQKNLMNKYKTLINANKEGQHEDQ